LRIFCCDTFCRRRPESAPRRCWLRLAGGLPLLFQLGRKLLFLDFGADLLAGISIVTALLTGEYLVGAIIVLMFSGGTALENWASGRASSALAALAHRLPRIAHRKCHDGFQDISADAVELGDRLVILPHETVPADGVVIEGNTVMDESYLTGEPFLYARLRAQKLSQGPLMGMHRFASKPRACRGIRVSPVSCASCRILNRSGLRSGD
jgi:Cation transport ATPase